MDAQQNQHVTNSEFCLTLDTKWKFCEPIKRQVHHVDWRDVALICQAPLAFVDDHLTKFTMSNLGSHKIFYFKLKADLNFEYTCLLARNGSWLVTTPLLEPITMKVESDGKLTVTGLDENLWHKSVPKSHVAHVMHLLWMSTSAEKFEQIIQAEFPKKLGHQMLLCLLFVGNVVHQQTKSNKITFI